MRVSVRKYIGYDYQVGGYERMHEELYRCPECTQPYVMRLEHGSVETCGNHNLIRYGNQIEVWDRDKPPFPLTPGERRYRAWESQMIDSMAAAGNFGAIASFQIAEKQKRGG